MIFYLIAIRYVQAMLKHSHSFFHYLYMWMSANGTGTNLFLYVYTVLPRSSGQMSVMVFYLLNI